MGFWQTILRILTFGLWGRQTRASRTRAIGRRVREEEGLVRYETRLERAEGKELRTIIKGLAALRHLTANLHYRSKLPIERLITELKRVQNADQSIAAERSTLATIHREWGVLEQEAQRFLVELHSGDERKLAEDFIARVRRIEGHFRRLGQELNMELKAAAELEQDERAGAQETKAEEQAA